MPMNQESQTITTVTTQYDEKEDRIRLSVVNRHQQSFVLWLTRRLAERMVPALLSGIKPRVNEEEASAQVAQETQAAQAAQFYEQLEARLSKKPAKPVKPPSFAPQGLIREITLKTADNGTRILIFHADDMPATKLIVTPKELRQWLEALRVGFHKGQWRQDLWPDWIKSP